METQTTNNFEFHNVSEHSPIGPPNRQPINKYIHINIFIYTSMCTYIKSKQRLFSYSLCSRFVKTIKNWEPKNHTPKVEKIVPPPSRSTTRRSGRSRTIVPPRPGGPHPKPWPGPEGHQLFLSFRCWFFKRLRLPSGSTGSGRSRTIVPPDQVGHTPNPGRVLKDTSFFSLFAAGFLNVFVFQVVRLWREWRESRNTTE